jgi:hypothetical protein
MKIIVAQIIPMSAAACSTCPADIVEFNNALPGWAAGLTTAQSPITLVDQWTGFDAVADTVDGVHPNTGGFQKMANRWYPKLASVLGAVTPPSPSPTSSPPTSAPPSSSPCVATYKVVSQWGGAFQGEVGVQNTGTAPSSAWTATFSFANGQQIGQSWNTALSQSGAAVTARNAAYNGTLPAGGSTTFGFIASWNNATNAAPTVRCSLT